MTPKQVVYAVTCEIHITNYVKVNTQVYKCRRERERDYIILLLLEAPLQTHRLLGDHKSWGIWLGFGRALAIF